MSYDYSEYQDTDVPEEKGLSQLNNLVVRQLEAEKEVERLTKELKEAKNKFEEVACRELPSLMEQLGLESFRTSTGFKIIIKTEFRHSLAKDRKEKALEWLTNNECGDIIKKLVSVPFVVGQEKEAEELLKQLQEKYGPIASLQGDVASQTLKATLKRLIDKGVDVPFDLFGLWEQKTAKID